MYTSHRSPPPPSRWQSPDACSVKGPLLPIGIIGSGSLIVILIAVVLLLVGSHGERYQHAAACPGPLLPSSAGGEESEQTRRKLADSNRVVRRCRVSGEEGNLDCEADARLMARQMRTARRDMQADEGVGGADAKQAELKPSTETCAALKFPPELAQQEPCLSSKASTEPLVPVIVSGLATWTILSIRYSRLRNRRSSEAGSLSRECVKPLAACEVRTLRSAARCQSKSPGSFVPCSMTKVHGMT
jgi:hypothetical protein